MKNVNVILSVLGVALVGGLAWLYLTFGWWAAILAIILLGFGLYELANNKDIRLQIDGNDAGIPSDQEFKSMGWKVDEWFNRSVLVSAINGDEGWDVARWKLQKVAYSITRPEVKQKQKDWFREFMMRFAAGDPVYQATIERVKNLLRDRPGIVQSEVYRGRNDKEKESARYILYFADHLGDIRREKSGRSYRLYLPDHQSSL